MKVFSCKKAGNVGRHSSGSHSPFPDPLICTLGKKITQPLEVSVFLGRGDGSPRHWWLVGGEGLGSGECAGMGVKTEVAHTAVLASNIQALLGLRTLREARFKFRVCLAM